MDDNRRDAYIGMTLSGLSQFDIAFLSFISIYFFLQLFILPFTPIYVENDQLLAVSNAMRMLDGEVMYRDFFHLSPPGTELYYAALFSILGVKIWIVNATIFLLAISQLAIVFAFSKRIFSGVYCYLPTLIYFVVGFRPFGIDGSFRLFSVIFVLAAALVIAYKRSPKAVAIAGSLCGIASFFVQTRGLLGIGAVGLFLLWHQANEGLEVRKLLKHWIIASASFLFVVVVTQLYMAWRGGFDNYFFANVIFIKDYYRSDTLSNTFAYFSDLPNLNSYYETYGTGGAILRYVRVALPTIFFYGLVPAVYAAYAVYRKFRTVESRIDGDLMLLSIMGTILYLGASAPTAIRLYHISIPAVIVTVWLFSKLVPNTTLASLLSVCLVALGLLYCVQRQLSVHVTLDLPAGKAAFLAVHTAEKYEWLSEDTDPGEYIYEAQHPTYYFPLHLKNPTPFYLVRDNNYTPPFQVEQLMQSLQLNPPRIIVWHGLWSKEPGERRAGDNLAPLWEFVRSNYRLKKEFREHGEFTVNSERDIEFWERRAAGPGSDIP